MEWSLYYRNKIEEFSRDDIQSLIKEYNHRVSLGRGGGWSVWGAYRRQIDKALEAELRKRNIDLSEIDCGDYFDYSQEVEYNQELNKIIKH